MHLKILGKPDIIVFKRWTRRRVSLMLSVSRVIRIGVLCLSYSLVNREPLVAQSDTVATLRSTDIEEVEISGKRSQTVFSELSRIVVVIRQDDIEKAGVQSILDLLEFVSNVDIRQRGMHGVQADVSMRGGSFDHVMILVNGINLNNPQTGHLNLDIPIDPESIEKIEVLEGPGARTLGPGAFTGAINIITKRGDANQLFASETYGGYGLRRTLLNAGFKTGQLQNFFSASGSSADGYAPNTDYRLFNLYYRGNVESKQSVFDFQTGFQSKAFGAAGFYPPKFLNQYEETDMGFASLKISTGSLVRITPAVSWRRSKDHYLLDRSNPSLYENFHLTDVYAGQLNFAFFVKRIAISLGTDLRSENIVSNNLGFEHPQKISVKGEENAFYNKRYGRTNLAVFEETSFCLGKLKINGGFMVQLNSAYPQKTSVFPGLDLAWPLTRNSILYSSLNRALHLPTFTDLFYKDPTHEGNINLKPNSMVSLEGGIKHKGNSVVVNSGLFYQTAHDMIDWLWSYTNGRYASVNLEQFRAYGITGHGTIDLGQKTSGWVQSVSLSGLWMKSDKSLSDSVSKYYNLKTKISLSVKHKLTSWLMCAWNVSYQDRNGEAMGYRPDEKKFFSTPYEAYWIIDGSLRCSYRFFEIFTEISNLTNTHYIDAGSRLQPGRWGKVGISVKI